MAQLGSLAIKIRIQRIHGCHFQSEFLKEKNWIAVL